jgi:hypothetical protein
LKKKTIKGLVKAECANFDYENNFCLPKNEICCFYVDEKLPRCKYFERGVLPLIPELEIQYRCDRHMSTNENIDICDRCGSYLKVNSNSQKYCDDCKKIIQKQQVRERKQKERDMSRNRT